MGQQYISYSMRVKPSPETRDRFKAFFSLIVNERVKTNIQQAIPFWIASLLTGLIAVAYTSVFNLCEHLLRQSLNWHGWVIFIFAPINFLIAYFIIRIFCPAARGSGIPQVMAAIDLATPKYEVGMKKLLNFRVILTKIASSLFMVLGGGAIGREGPTIQIAGSVFRIFNRWIPNSWPRLSSQNFILTGAAAGLAAAFNTPLGGIVFAIEELARIHISFFRSALFTAVIIAGLTAQGLLGPYLYLGYPDVKSLSPFIFFGVALAAILSGILGALMCKATLRIMKWKRHFSHFKNVLFIIGAGLLVASVAYWFDVEILGSGKNVMNDALFSHSKHVPWHTTLVRIIGPILAFNVGASGGIFAPALSAGAAIGGSLANLLNILDANANILILSGMVGFLTGVTRTPFTSAILVLEMTDRHSVIFHLMLAALIGNIAALVIEKHSFYEQLKHTYIDEIKEEMVEKIIPPGPLPGKKSEP